jgi:hypothetical protein
MASLSQIGEGEKHSVNEQSQVERHCYCCDFGHDATMQRCADLIGSDLPSLGKPYHTVLINTQTVAAQML